MIYQEDHNKINLEISEKINEIKTGLRSNFGLRTKISSSEINLPEKIKAFLHEEKKDFWVVTYHIPRDEKMEDVLGKLKKFTEE